MYVGPIPGSTAQVSTCSATDVSSDVLIGLIPTGFYYMYSDGLSDLTHSW